MLEEDKTAAGVVVRETLAAHTFHLLEVEREVKTTEQKMVGMDRMGRKSAVGDTVALVVVVVPLAPVQVRRRDDDGGEVLN